MWKAYCRSIGQLIGWKCGDRDEKTLKKLPECLKKLDVSVFFTNHWRVYAEFHTLRDTRAC
jgi:IS1 family transposase